MAITKDTARHIPITDTRRPMLLSLPIGRPTKRTGQDATEAGMARATGRTDMGMASPTAVRMVACTLTSGHCILTLGIKPTAPANQCRKAFPAARMSCVGAICRRLAVAVQYRNGIIRRRLVSLYSRVVFPRLCDFSLDRPRVAKPATNC